MAGIPSQLCDFPVSLFCATVVQELLELPVLGE